MKTFIASSLIALSLVTGLATAANADTQFGTRGWWDTTQTGG